jgi:voltage-gated potassium channel
VVETSTAGNVTARLMLPSGSSSPVRLLGVRILIALSCLVATTALVYFERDGYTDNNDDGISLLDAVYYATVTLSTTGYGDITPASDLARITNIVAITPLRFLFLIVLVGTALETLTKRTREEWRAEKWRRKVRDHTLVIGFGVKGRAAAQAVMDAGTSAERIVVVTADLESAMEAKRVGLASIVGDARREEILMDAGIDRANRVIITTNADDTSVLITLAARRLAPHAKIVSSARESASAQVLRDSGADGVIVTAEAAGRLLSMRLLSPYAGDLMEDLLDSSRGLEVVERPITAEELGLGPEDLEGRGEIVLAVIRDGRMVRFDQSTIRVFQRDDVVVVVRQRPEWSGPSPLQP